MTAPTNQAHRPSCLACGKTPLESVSIHSGLARRHRSIRDQIVGIVGTQRTDEACQTSEIVCLLCLKLLLNINNLELELDSLKQEFHAVFQLGVELRKSSTDKSTVHLSTEEGDQSICDNDDSDVNRRDNVLFLNTNENDGEDRTNGSEDSDVSRKDNVLFLNTNENDGEDRTNGSEDSDADDDNEIQHDENGSILKAVYNNTDNECRTKEDEIRNINIIQSSTGKNDISYCPISGKDTSVTKGNGIQIESLKRSEQAATRQKKTTPDSPKTESRSQTDERSLSNRDPITALDVECKAKHQEKLHITGLSTARTDVTSDIWDAEIQSNADIVVSGNDPKDVANEGLKRSRRKTIVSQAIQPRKRRKTVRPCKKTAKLKKENETDCTLDDVPSGDREILEDFRQDHNRTNACKICGEKYSSPNKLADHKARVHADLYKYVCDKCPNVRYCNKWELTRHCKSQHQVHIHQCPGCGIEEASQQSLDQHIIKEHPESRYFRCKICGKAFRTYRYLHFVHIKRCHIGLPIKYHCDKCNKGFKDKSSLDNHRHTHSEVKNYSCEFCGALFRSPYSLKVHVNTHTQEKKYTCLICGMSFLRLCNLIGHRKYVHSRDNRYVCEVCGKVVHTHKGLVRHQILYHAKGKLFSCDECDQSFSKKESLKAHLLAQHSQERPHKCDCGKAYANSSRLRRHLKSAHGLDHGQELGVEEALLDDGSKVVDVDNEEENMVVITVKECTPHMYSVQSASPHSHKVMVTSDTPSSHVVTGAGVGTEPVGTAHRMELPLLHSAFSTITADRIGLSTPILFAALNSNPIATVHQTKGTIPDGMSLSSFEPTITQDSNHLQTTNPFHSTSIVSSDEQNSLEILQEESSCLQNDSPLPSELLELPAMHPNAPNGVPVTYITSWPT